MGDHMDGNTMLEKPQLFKLFGLLQRRLPHLAELTQCVWSVGIEPNMPPVFGPNVVAVKWNQ